MPFKSLKSPGILLALCLGASSLSAFAQWQWLDKDGRKVFSDRGPPPEIPEKNILKRPGLVAKKEPDPATPAPETTKDAATVAKTAPKPEVKTSGVDKELEEKKKQTEDAEKAKRKAEEEQRLKNQIENCARAKQNKAELTSGSRMTRMGTNGEREFLDEAAKAVELQRVQVIIQRDCK